MSPHILTPHLAYVIAAKLRLHSVYACGRDILHWSPATVEAAERWLRQADSPAAVSWQSFMGALTPPTPARYWHVTPPIRKPAPTRKFLKMHPS